MKRRTWQALFDHVKQRYFPQEPLLQLWDLKREEFDCDHDYRLDFEAKQLVLSVDFSPPDPVEFLICVLASAAVDTPRRGHAWALRMQAAAVFASDTGDDSLADLLEAFVEAEEDPDAA